MLGLNTSEFSFTKNSHENKAFLSSGNLTLAQSIQPKFPKILDRFGPTGKVSKKLDHLLRVHRFGGMPDLAIFRGDTWDAG